MEIKKINVDELRPYENNPRCNDTAVEYVANSIREFGFRQPIVIDKDNVIIAGHTRYKASLMLGLEAVPCVIADDLNEEQVKAYRLADNKVGELAEWDFELLDSELAEILDFDMADFAFIDEEEDGFIDDLFNEEYTSMLAREGKETFNITFTFDIEHEDVVSRYMKANGKDSMIRVIVAEAEQWNADNY